MDTEPNPTNQDLDLMYEQALSVIEHDGLRDVVRRLGVITSATTDEKIHDEVDAILSAILNVYIMMPADTP